MLCAVAPTVVHLYLILTYLALTTNVRLKAFRGQTLLTMTSDFYLGRLFSMFADLVISPDLGFNSTTTSNETDPFQKYLFKIHQKIGKLRAGILSQMGPTAKCISRLGEAMLPEQGTML